MAESFSVGGSLKLRLGMVTFNVISTEVPHQLGESRVGWALAHAVILRSLPESLHVLACPLPIGGQGSSICTWLGDAESIFEHLNFGHSDLFPPQGVLWRI